MWGTITVNPSVEQVKNVVTGETYSWESVPRGRGFREAAARVELISHRWNAEGMRVVRDNVSALAGSNRKSQNGWKQAAQFIRPLSMDVVIEPDPIC